MLDTQAVVDHLGLNRFALLGFLHSDLIAIPYAMKQYRRARCADC